jgi:DNA-binding HxlR family transcriptional regulator
MAAGAASDTVPALSGEDFGESPDRSSNGTSNGHPEAGKACCGLYHQAVELVGKRWTGAILLVLLDRPLRFSEIRQLVADLSDRLLSERLKELESEGIVERTVVDGGPVRVEYGLTAKGQALEPAVKALKDWARRWTT